MYVPFVIAGRPTCSLSLGNFGLLRPAMLPLDIHLGISATIPRSMRPFGSVGRERCPSPLRASVLPALGSEALATAARPGPAPRDPVAHKAPP